MHETNAPNGGRRKSLPLDRFHTPFASKSKPSPRVREGPPKHRNTIIHPARIAMQYLLGYKCPFVHLFGDGRRDEPPPLMGDVHVVRSGCGGA